MTTNIYDTQFEFWLTDRGFDLDSISLKDCLNELKRFNKYVELNGNYEI